MIRPILSNRTGQEIARETRTQRILNFCASQAPTSGNMFTVVRCGGAYKFHRATRICSVQMSGFIKADDTASAGHFFGSLGLFLRDTNDTQFTSGSQSNNPTRTEALAVSHCAHGDVGGGVQYATFPPIVQYFENLIVPAGKFLALYIGGSTGALIGAYTTVVIDENV